MKIHLINLDRSRDRLAAFQTTNRHIVANTERFAAVDGRTVDRKALAKDGVIAADLDYSDGALGNALSHFALWDVAIKHKQPLTICEDDAVFHNSFLPLSGTVLDALPADWHFILWGWNFDSLLWFDMLPAVSGCIGLFDQAALRKGLNAFQSADLQPRPFRLFQGFGIMCYSISPRGAQWFRESCLPLKNSTTYIPGMRTALPNTSLDVALNGLYADKSCFVSFPPIAATANDHDASTVVIKEGNL